MIGLPAVRAWAFPRSQPLHLPGSWEPADWIVLVLMVVLAIAPRLLFFSGFFGSDDADSLQAATALAQGNWRPTSTYLPSLRYGITIPMAVAVRLFGPSEFAVSLWPFVCSITEVTLVFGVARVLWELKAAVLAAALMAVTPLHVLHASLPTGDAPLALVTTLSMTLFLLAESRGTWLLYFVAGLSIGMTFWVKEAIIVVWAGAFAICAMVIRPWRLKWLWVLAGVLLALTANTILFWCVAGDPLYYVRVIANRRSVFDAYITAGKAAPIWLYFYYLFFDIRHTWLVAYFAVLGVVVWLMGSITRSADTWTTFVVFWWAGLFLPLNFSIIKLQPLTFIFKQSNYMLIFWAPIVLLAAFFLTRLSMPYLVTVLVVTLSGGLCLAALEQQSVRIFTANSRAAWMFASQARSTPIYVNQHAVNLARMLQIVDTRTTISPVLRPLAELQATAMDASTPPSSHPVERTAIVDFETLHWGGDPPLTADSIPSCWHRLRRLEPVGLGAGARVAALLQRAAGLFPGSVGAKITGKLGDLTTPKPAVVFQIPTDCTFSLPRN